MPEIVVHLEVKQHVVCPTARDIEEFETVNVQGTQTWLDWCTRNGIRNFVYFSSIKVVKPATHGLTDESAAESHESYYGASKWAAERRVREWVCCCPDRSALIVRPAVIYGPGNVGNVGTMVAAIDRGRFFLVGRNDNVKSLVSIKNVAAAVIHLIENMQPSRCEIYNLVDRESYSVREIDAMIRARLGKRANSPTLPLRFGRIAALTGDLVHRVTGRTSPISTPRLEALIERTHFSCDKLMSTGFVHPQSTAEGVAEMVEWYRTGLRPA